MVVRNVEPTPAEQELLTKHRRRHKGAIFTQAVQVERTTAGVPVRVHWQNRVWKVVAEPVRWYVRRPWWEEEYRVAKEGILGSVEEEIWRLQVALNNSSQARTIDVGHQEDTGRWRLLYVHDIALSA